MVVTLLTAVLTTGVTVEVVVVVAVGTTDRCSMAPVDAVVMWGTTATGCEMTVAATGAA